MPEDSHKPVKTSTGDDWNRIYAEAAASEGLHPRGDSVNAWASFMQSSGYSCRMNGDLLKRIVDTIAANATPRLDPIGSFSMKAPGADDYIPFALLMIGAVTGPFWTFGEHFPREDGAGGWKLWPRANDDDEVICWMPMAKAYEFAAVHALEMPVDQMVFELTDEIREAVE